MLIDLKYVTDLNIIDKMNYSNRNFYTRYIKQLFKIPTTMSIEEWFENNAQEEYENEVKRCVFCNRFKKIEKIKIEVLQYYLRVKIELYKSPLFTCTGRKELTNCQSRKLNHNSIEYVSKSRNVSEEEARKIIHSRNSSPFYRCNHSTDEEYANYQRRDENWFNDNGLNLKEITKKRVYKTSLKGYKERYGEELGKLKYEELCKRKDNSSLNHFIEKYGEEEGKIKYKKKCHNISFYNSLEGYKERYGEELGKLKYEEVLNKQINGFGKASKESLRNIFIKLYRILRKEFKFEKSDILFGMGKSKELFIYDRENKKISMYDFTIKPLKIIVEYNGSMFHNNPKFDYRKINLPFNNKAIEYKKKDKYKKKLAEKNGFTVIEVYDTDDFNKKIEEILNLVKENMWKMLF